MNLFAIIRFEWRNLDKQKFVGIWIMPAEGEEVKIFRPYADGIRAFFSQKAKHEVENVVLASPIRQGTHTLPYKCGVA